MDLHLEFSNSVMSGDGNDDIGRFLIKGKYDEVGGECTFHKTYVGAHDVFYRGFREGKGIWGTWEIGSYERGGFHIWPLNSAAGEEKGIEAEEIAPAAAPHAPAHTTTGGLIRDEALEQFT